MKPEHSGKLFSRSFNGYNAQMTPIFIYGNGDQVLIMNYTHFFKIFSILLLCLFGFANNLAANEGPVRWNLREKGKYRLYNYDDRREITPPLYNDYLSIIDGIAPARLGDKWGVLNTDGKILVPFVYDYLFYFHGANGQPDAMNGISAAQYNGKWGFINLKNKAVIPLIYDEMQASELNDLGEYIIVKLNGKYGCINRAGGTLIPFRYHGMSFFDYKKSPIVKASNEKGQEVTVVVEPGGLVREYSSTQGIDRFRDDPARLIWAVQAETGFVTYLRADGTRLVPAEYEVAKINPYPAAFSDGMARVYKNGQYGFIDMSGRLAISPAYELALEKGGYVLMQTPRDFVHEMRPCLFPDGEPCQLGVSPDNLRDMAFEHLWKNEFGKNGSKTNAVGEFSNGLALIAEKGLYGYIDKMGKVIIAPQYESGAAFEEIKSRNGTVFICGAVMKKGKWALIGQSGELLTKFKYKNLWAAFESVK